MTLYDLDDFLDMPPVKRGRRGASVAEEDDEEYRRKRERNNEVCMYLIQIGIGHR